MCGSARRAATVVYPRQQVPHSHRVPGRTAHLNARESNVEGPRARHTPKPCSAIEKDARHR
eukprot:5659145-Pyramimonas_sp.AAC.1